MRAVCVVLNAILSNGDIMTNEELTLSRGFARGSEQVMLPRIGVLVLSMVGRSDRSTEMALSDHRRSLAGNCEIGHGWSPSPAGGRRDVGRYPFSRPVSPRDPRMRQPRADDLRRMRLY